MRHRPTDLDELDLRSLQQRRSAKWRFHPRDILPAFAREYDADLVVMGALARTGLKRRILGSTAEQVLDNLPCDILIVRPD